MQYSLALTLVLALSFAVGSEGFRKKRKARDQKLLAAGDVEKEWPSFTQEEIEEQAHANVSGPTNSIKVAYGTPLTNAQWKSMRDFVVFVNPAGSCCTGTISGNVVLTAAHCVRGKSLSQITVKTCDKSNVKVTKIAIHPSYNPQSSANDVALLWLSSSHSARKQVYLSSRRLPVGDLVAIAGFGKTQSKGCGSLHDSGRMKTTSCRKHSSIACAGSGSGSGVSSCGGDSGGPWYQTSSTGSSFYIVGVNSFGINGDCGDKNKQTGFIRTTAVSSWIKQQTSAFKWSSKSR